VPEHVAVRRFADETVLLNLETGQYHSLDEVGSTFLETLQDTPEIAKASARLAERYGIGLERAQSDLGDFCAALRARGLLTFEVEGNDS
jgi:hypothetical protein